MELNGKKVINVEIDGLHRWDAPDYCDAYVYFACWEDGTPLTEEDRGERAWEIDAGKGNDSRKLKLFVPQRAFRNGKCSRQKKGCKRRNSVAR